MAHITLTGTLLNPNGVTAAGDKIRFTHKSTTGQTVEGAVSILTIIPSGLYSIDLQYGTVLVEYQDSGSPLFKNVGVVTVNSTNVATTIPQLLGSAVPPSSSELILFQTILAQSLTAQAAAEAAVGAAESQVDAAAVQVQAAEAAAASVVNQFQTDTGAGLIGTAAGTSLQANIDALTAGQTGGIIAFTTYALLDAYTPTTSQQSTSFKVTNDSDISLNGYYHWVSGTTYEKDAEDTSLVVNVIDDSNTSDAVSGKSVSDYVSDEIDTIPAQNHIGPVLYSIADENGNPAVELLADGTYRVAKIDVKNRVDSTLPVGQISQFVHSIIDESGDVAFGVKSDGTAVASGYELPDGSKIGQSGLPTYYHKTSVSDIDCIINYGQSNAHGGSYSTPAISNTQPYNNLLIGATGFEPLELTVAQAEWPSVRAADHIIALTLQDSNRALGSVPLQMATYDPSTGGVGIDALLNPASGSWKALEKGIVDGNNFANAEGKSFNVKAINWTHGESDEIGGMDTETYYGKQNELYDNVNNFAKATTGQTNDIYLFSWQLAVGPSGQIGPSNLLSNSRHPKQVTIFPKYLPPNSGDGNHLSALGMGIAGAYYAKVYKKIIVDGGDWSPLLPTSIRKEDDTVYIEYNQDGLIFDSTLYPAVPDGGMGFYGNDDSGALTVVSLTISINGVIKVVFNRPFTTNSSFGYGAAMSNRLDGYLGIGGNLRNSAGLHDKVTIDSIVYDLHDWGLTFEEIF